MLALNSAHIPGKSGRDILDALVRGTRDAEVLAELARGRLRVKIPALTQALTGRFGPTHALVVGEILAHLDYLDGAIGRVSARIDDLIRPFTIERDLLATIPGVDKRLAEALIAEIGVDMTRFENPGRLASWAGMCPGQHESAGRSRSGRAPTRRHPRAESIWRSRRWPQPGPRTPTWPRSTPGWSAGAVRPAPERPSDTRSSSRRSTSSPAASPTPSSAATTTSKRNSPERRAHKNLNDLKALGWTITHTPDGVTCTPPRAA